MSLGDMNPTKVSRTWKCGRCGTVNKESHRYCDKCFNEPTAGRRDVDPEGRKFDPSYGDPQ